MRNIRHSPAVRRSTLALTLFILAGCGSGSVTTASPTTPAHSVAASPTVAPELPVYHEGDPHPIPAGTYVTGSAGFFPGLKLTIPSGWTATETDRGEIGLHPDDRPDDLLMIWKDMAAVVTHNRNQNVGHVRGDVGHTAKELLDWITTTPDFSILSKPASATAGSSINGTQLTLAVSDTANFAWNDCPDTPRCAAILTDPRHWGSNFYAIGGDEVARIFIATVHYPEGNHTLFITLDTPNKDELATFAPEAQTIIGSLQVPVRFTDN
jgi:hypothetical protein